MSRPAGNGQTAPERLFVAVALDDATREALAQQLPHSLPGRVVAPRNWHFTLRFLGPVFREERERVIAELGSEPLGPPFGIRLAGIGAFPAEARARTLWVGVADGAQQLTALAGSVRAACSRAGAAPDERHFRPHLTVSRLEPPRSVRELLATTVEVPLMPVQEILLVRSRLGQGQPLYEAINRFRLTVG